ncbi:hypothetical protein EDC04DRAFT_2887048 [Pisolithus marmoratus]|nr:hypothetical protein EDC04DRAFT_2887048 [Pisolithus marmoratus]
MSLREGLCRGQHGTYNVALCMECSHGKSKHNPPQNLSGPPVPSSNLATIFQNVLGMAATSSQPSNIIPQKTACTEALGTKKVAKPSQLTKASTSTGDCKSSHGIVTSGRSFWVSSIAMLTCGLDTKGHLLDETLPGGYKQKVEFLITLQNHGCLIWTQQHESGYLINMSWSYEEKDKTALQLDWQVLNCSQGHNFSVIQESFPMGQTLSTFKGHAKAGTSDSHLWLVTQNPIPDAVFNSWNTQTLVVGTDDEGDNSTGEVQSLDEDQSSGEDLIDLSSSFTDLGFDKSGTGTIMIFSKMYFFNPSNNTRQMSDQLAIIA